MLGDISAASEIYLVCGYTDMRKSIDGLRAIVEGTLKLDSKDHSLFLFCGRRCDRMKALIWEGDGYVLLYKRLDVENGRYRWPRDKSEARNLTWQQFDWLMSGIDSGERTTTTRFPSYFFILMPKCITSWIISTPRP